MRCNPSKSIPCQRARKTIRRRASLWGDSTDLVFMNVAREAIEISDGETPYCAADSHGNGNGAFSDVTEVAGPLSLHPTQTAVWFDFNKDGWIDLYIHRP